MWYSTKYVWYARSNPESRSRIELLINADSTEVDLGPCSVHVRR